MDKDKGGRRIYYVYILRRPDRIDPFDEGKGQPFYVGKGHSEGRYSRIKQHRIDANGIKRQSCKTKRTHKTNIILHLWNNDMDYVSEIIFKSSNEEDVLNKEKELILKYGRLNNKTGILTNKTDGGLGIPGHNHSDEFRQKMSLAWKGVPKTEEFKEKMRQYGKERGISREMMEKAWESIRGKPLAEKRRKQISELCKGKKLSEEHRNKIRQAVQGSKNGYSKINEQDVYKIRKLGEDGLSYKQISLMFDLSDAAIRLIIQRKRWKHI